MSIPAGASSGRSKVRGYGPFPVRSDSGNHSQTDSRRSGNPGWDGMGKGGAKSSYVRPAVPDGVTTDREGADAWAGVVNEMHERLGVNMARLWIDPLLYTGTRNGSLVVTGDYRLTRWVAVRYGKVIGDVCRDAGFKGVLICETKGER